MLAWGKSGIVNEIIEAAGGVNVIEQPKKLVRISEEILFQKEPDVYIIQQGPMNPIPQALEERPAFKNLHSAQKVLIVDERKFARPGPNSVESAEILHDFLFPTQER